MKFETGKTYIFYGDTKVTVVRRTEKTVWLKINLGSWPVRQSIIKHNPKWENGLIAKRVWTNFEGNESFQLMGQHGLACSCTGEYDIDLQGVEEVAK